MGLYGFYSRDDRTERERELEDELERERDAARERDRREDEAREERRREFRERMDYEERQADTWPEAFQKQANLCWREHNRYPDDLDDGYFEQTAKANEKALELWMEVSKSKEMELEALRHQIDAVYDAIRNEVADKLAASSERREFEMVASVIRDNELAGYLDW